MKKGIVLALALILTCSIVVFAQQEDTGRGNYTTPIAPLTNLLNDNDLFHHNHSYTQYEPKAKLGLGVDITLYTFGEGLQKWGLESVEAQNKYDFSNKNYGGFIVLQLDGPSIFKSVKGLFTK